MSRATATAFDSIRSASTAPAPTDGKLIDVADEDHASPRRHGLQEPVHQDDIDHRRFIDDEQIDVERVLRVAAEAAHGGVEFEEAVDGLRLAAGRFGQALGGAAGRRARATRAATWR